MAPWLSLTRENNHIYSLWVLSIRDLLCCDTSWPVLQTCGTPGSGVSRRAVPSPQSLL